MNSKLKTNSKDSLTDMDPINFIDHQNIPIMKAMISDIINFIGDDSTREGVKETPLRVVRSWDELYSGYKKNPMDLLKTFDKDSYDQIVICKDTEMYSMCEHHMLPFIGKAHVAYIPGDQGRVIGISKLARLVDIYSRRLQIQERIGEQVTNFLMDHLRAKGAACIIEAQHLCMRMRGVGKQNSTMVTSSMKGVFYENAIARQELLNLIRL